jgi:hypothetical protein
MKRKSAFHQIMMHGATRLLVPCTIYIIAEYQTKLVKKRLSHNMRGSFNVVGTLSLLSVLLLSVDGLAAACHNESVVSFLSSLPHFDPMHNIMLGYHYQSWMWTMKW